MASAVMHFYAMSLSDFYKLPVYLFWELARNINRIRAEEDLRLLVIVSSAFGTSSELHQGLIEERGDIIIAEESASDGINALRALMHM